jgi:hypothetical protein
MEYVLNRTAGSGSERGDDRMVISQNSRININAISDYFLDRMEDRSSIIGSERIDDGVIFPPLFNFPA